MLQWMYIHVHDGLWVPPTPSDGLWVPPTPSDGLWDSPSPGDGINDLVVLFRGILEGLPSGDHVVEEVLYHYLRALIACTGFGLCHTPWLKWD